VSYSRTSYSRTFAANSSFTVFDYKNSQRRTYYHPHTASHQTTSGSTAVLHERSSGDQYVKKPTAVPATYLTPSTELSPVNPRSYTPGSDKHLASRTGHEIEQQIMEGGGLANFGSRAGAKQLETETPGSNSATTSEQRR
jgi:serine/threonine kinase 32